MRPLRSAGQALAGALLLSATPLVAQDGGVWLRLNLDQRFEAIDNADLDETSSGTTWRSDTRLGFNLSSETRTEYFGLSLGGSLRRVEAPNDIDNVSFGFRAPSATLSYRRTAATARLDASLNASTQDISYLQSLEDILTGDDDAPLSVALDEETGTGTRRQIGANATLSFGIGGPAEGSITLGARTVDYFDIGTADYQDSDSANLRTNLRLTLAPDLALTGALGWRIFEEDGEKARETWTFNTGLVKARTDGTLRADLNLTRIEEGTRIGLSGGWTRTLPEGELAFNLGATRGASGEIGATGSASYSQNLPNGRLNARLSRGFTADADDAESIVTTLSGGYSRALGPLTNLQLDMVFAQTEDSDSGDTVSRAQVGAGVSHDLGHDWSLGIGYRHAWRQDEAVGIDNARSDTIYMTLGKAISVRY